MKKLAIVFSLVLVANLALAQGFHLISTDPAEGTVNVPHNTIISFTFNAPLDTTWHFGDEDEPVPVGALGPEPEDSVEVVDWWVSPDLTTISVQVEHQMEGDFLWIILLAYSNTGEPLAEPACLHYSTSDSMGPWTVSGTIDAGEVDPTHTAVGLMAIPLFSDDEGGGMYAGTFVPDDSGDYTIPYVSNGVWWPVAAYDLNGDGTIDPESGDLLGFWDPDEDNQPDSVIVANGNLTEIDITLLDFIFQEVTAREYLPQAWELADEWADDQELRMIGAGTDIINLDGTAPGWGYLFWSPSGEFFTNIMIMSIFAQVDTTSEIGFPNDMLPIPANFLDSDEAMIIASENGITEFEQEYDLTERWLHGGNFRWVYPEHEDELFWVVGSTGIDPDNDEEVTLLIAMDIVTGEIVQIDWEDVGDPVDEQLPRDFELYHNYPNPFNPSTTISYALLLPAIVELAVYNINGELITTLVDGLQTAGTHTLQFDGSDLPSGVYFYNMKAGDISQTNRMLLVK